MCTHIYGRHCAHLQIKSESDTIFYYTIYVRMYVSSLKRHYEQQY